MGLLRRYRRGIAGSMPALGLSLSLSLGLALGAVTFAASGPASAASSGPQLGIATGGTFQFMSPAAQDTYLTQAHDLGATWLRFDFTWADIQRSNASTFDWARYDSTVAAATRHGLKVVGMIAYAPTWARDSACAGDKMCRPRSAKEFGTFAGQVAARYGPKGVHHWEIWNEPNTAQFFKPAADATIYTNLLNSAYTAIHAADAQAQVISGGAAPAPTSGGDIAPVEFLRRMYAAGAGGHFDILGHHPYCYAGSFDCPGTNADWSAWTQMAATSTSLRSLMTAQGDGTKPIWGTEFGAPTGGGAASVTEAHQATMLTDGLRRFGSYSWGGPLFLYSLQDQGTNASDKEDWFGVIRADGSHKPSYAALQSVLAGSVPPPATSTPAPVPTTPAPVPVTTAPVPVTTSPAPVTTPPAPAPSWTNLWTWIIGHWF